LAEVKEHQDRIRRREEYLMAREEVADGEPPEQEEEATVPEAVIPYLNKELNFELFLKLLTDKVDA
jgi:hypothetical protein